MDKATPAREPAIRSSWITTGIVSDKRFLLLTKPVYIKWLYSVMLLPGFITHSPVTLDFTEAAQ